MYKMKSGRTNIISDIVKPSVRIRLGNTYGRRQKSQGSEEVSKFFAIKSLQDRWLWTSWFLSNMINCLFLAKSIGTPDHHTQMSLLSHSETSHSEAGAPFTVIIGSNLLGRLSTRHWNMAVDISYSAMRISKVWEVWFTVGIPIHPIGLFRALSRPLKF